MSRAVSSFDAAIAKAPPEKLEEILEHYAELKRTWLRNVIIKRNRIDILAREILGYEVHPHHLAIMQHQFRHPQSLTLAWRGAGKTSVATVTKAIHTILKNPDTRILIPSKSADNAQAMLKEIKGHFENNKQLEEVFGKFFDPRLCRKWDTREIEVLPRKSNAKESTITTIGVGGTTVGRHYDMHLPDDLVDEENSKSSLVRGQLRTWHYKTLLPTLEPPDERIAERGEAHYSGTRYHPDDLYGTLMGENTSDDVGGDLKGDKALKIPVCDDEDRSAWPEKYPTSWIKNYREKQGLIIFNSQYKLDTEAMKGSIFRYDDCQRIELAEVPKNLPRFQGTDLAVGEDLEKGDHFSLCTIAYDRATDIVYVLDWFDEVIRFNQQRDKVIELYGVHDPVRNLIEAVGYQGVQVSEVKRKRPELRVFGFATKEDKITRAQKLSARFDSGKIFFVKGGKMHLLIEQLVRFPNDDVHDDGFDALDLAVRAIRMHARKKRRRVEPGIM